MDDRDLGSQIGTLKEKVEDLETEIACLKRKYDDRSAAKTAFNAVFFVLLVFAVLAVGWLYYWYFTGGFASDIIAVVAQSLKGN